MGWQDVAAIGAVLAAAGYLASLVLRGLFGRKPAGCGTGCGKCSSAAPDAAVQVVAIGGGAAVKKPADGPR